MKNLIVTVMLGMNRFSEKDADHPFDMSFLQKYNCLWLPQISKIEKKCSTLFYEVSKAVDEATAESRTKDNIAFIFGRGTIGDHSEESLQLTLTDALRQYGENTRNIVVAKSYGVVDTLQCFQMMKKEHIDFSIDMLILIDGYALPVSRMRVSKRYNGRRRFVIPRNVKKTFNVRQHNKGFKGLYAGSPNNKTVKNFTVKNVNSNYAGYSDGYVRQLDLSHFNMDEIACVTPCCKYNEAFYTMPEMIQKDVKRLQIFDF